MISLTEQWKKGKLPEGHYYVKDGKDLIAEYLDGFFYIYGEPTRVDKILAPVSSYEKWQRILEENTKLKNLLKECKRQFEEVELYRCDVADTDQEDWFKISTNQANVANKMIAKINQVLGEE